MYKSSFENTLYWFLMISVKNYWNCIKKARTSAWAVHSRNLSIWKAEMGRSEYEARINYIARLSVCLSVPLTAYVYLGRWEAEMNFSELKFRCQQVCVPWQKSKRVSEFFFFPDKRQLVFLFCFVLSHEFFTFPKPTLVS